MALDLLDELAEAANDQRIDTTGAVRRDGDVLDAQVRILGVRAVLAEPGVDPVHRAAGIARRARAVEEEDARVCCYEIHLISCPFERSATYPVDATRSKPIRSTRTGSEV